MENYFRFYFALEKTAKSAEKAMNVLCGNRFWCLACVFIVVDVSLYKLLMKTSIIFNSERINDKRSISRQLNCGRKFSISNINHDRRARMNESAHSSTAIYFINLWVNSQSRYLWKMPLEIEKKKMWTQKTLMTLKGMITNDVFR